MQKWVQNMKLGRKMQSVIICMAIVIILVELITQKYVYETYNTQLYQKTAQVLTAFSSELETHIQQVENLTSTIIGDPSIQDNLRMLRDTEALSPAWLTAKASFDIRTGYYSIQDEYIKHFKILSEYRLMDSNTGGWRLGNEAYIQAALNAHGKMVLIPEAGRLIMAREIRQTYLLEMSTLGVIIAQIDLNSLIRDYISRYQKIGVALEVSIFSQGHCLYQAGDIPVAEPQIIDGWKIEDDNFIVGVTSQALDCSFVIVTPYAQVENAIRQSTVRALLLVLTVTSLSILLAMKLLQRITHELTILVTQMDDMGVGMLPDKAAVLPYLDRKDEVGRLYRHFYRMSQDYQQLTAKHYNSMLLLKDAQFSQLQKQIHPHFLFNTLATISAMAYQKQNFELSHIVERLASMLRVTIRQSDALTTVESDLKMVEDYLYIQQIRYSERLQVHIDIPPTAYKLSLPPITLQPIVENSITHGLEEMLEPCQIRISFESDEKEAKIVVSDNGPGFSQEEFEKMLTAEETEGAHGIGLINIHKRLQLAFSNRYGLSVHRNEGWTQVIVHIPPKAQ